jgi:hypothetical protein
MATWKKVIVSGSNASLNQVSASGGINAILPSAGQPNIVAYDSASGTFSYAGTGSFTAATASYITASNVYGPYGSNSILSASYAVTAAYASNVPLTASYALTASVAISSSYSLSGSYALGATSASYAVTSSYANTAGQTVASLTQGVGVTSFTFNGASSATVAVSGASGLNSNRITKWDGVAFSNSSLTDDGTTISGATSLQLTGASSVLTGSFSGSLVGSLTGTASYATQALTASNANTASNIGPAISNNTNDYILTATGNGTINGESSLTWNGSLLTVTGNATITGDLSVAGTASFTNTENLNIKDKFILINSGSGVLADSGWITQYNAAGSGSAFYLEATSTGTYGRFAMAYDAVGATSALTADEYVVSAKQASGAPSGNPTWGGSGNGFGNIYVDSGNGDIYIYA